jgi:hypothetical protein
VPVNRVNIDPHGSAVTFVIVAVVLAFCINVIFNRERVRQIRYLAAEKEAQATVNPDEMMTLKRMQDIEPLNVSWSSLKSLAQSMGVELLPSQENIEKAYVGDKSTWDGVLRGRCLDVLSVAAMAQRVLPVVFGKFDVNGGVMAVSLSVIGAKQ